ncbi:MSCRAMM family protein [Archangium lipolyticum]|uniref:MSCRAMM family protein n=1 Tax=Archangium lipolyticum TaxID=2970465 RepID=UPI00214A88DE|nr:carboxypeptidase regulatory-like domain-containing protein [Archangium lipolyticum]
MRLRYGLTFREGAQEAGPAVSYGGMTPNDVALWAAVFGEGWWGAWASVQREGFSLSKETRLITGGGLLRASVGPAARVSLGPVRAEVSAGYGFAQLPTFASAEGGARLVASARHAALVGARVLVPLPWRLRAEVRGEVPVALGASSTGFAAGGALLVPVMRRGEWGGALVLDYQYVRDELTTADGLKSSQVLSRAGLAFELTHGGGEASRPRLGELVLAVVEEGSGKALPGARVVLTVGGVGQAPRVLGADGRLTGVELPPGEVLVRVDVEGYLPLEARTTVTAGGRSELVLRTNPLPRVGTLEVFVVDGRNGTPLPGALVTVGGTEVTTNEMGLALLKELPPGPLEVKVSAPDFRAEQEAVVIAAGIVSQLSVSLTHGRQGALATLSGQVRSVRGGKPLQARLFIPEAKLRRRTDARGTFQVQLKQGRYRLVFSAPGHLSQTKVITVGDGEQAIFNVDLFPKTR